MREARGKGAHNVPSIRRERKRTQTIREELLYSQF